MTHVTPSVVGALVVALATAAGAQSLGDVARKEEARRKAVSKAGRTYTNESLQGTPSEAPQAAPAPAAAPPAGDGKAPDQTKEPDPKKDEAYWRGRVTQVRDGLERARTFREALQSQINALTADFSRRDDPAQRGVVASNRQKALAELERVNKEIADFEKQLVDIEDEARKAGVPPGWIR